MSEADRKAVYGFRGEVAAIVLLQEYEGEAIPTLLGDNYVVVIKEIVSVFGSIPDCRQHVLAYVIHSPARLFSIPSDQAVGERFEFTVYTAGAKGAPPVLKATGLPCRVSI